MEIPRAYPLAAVNPVVSQTGVALPMEPAVSARQRRGSIAIREADLNRELTLIADTVNASFDSRLTLERFRWLYQQNPDGPAIAWLAFDEASGTVVGTTAACPRRMRLGTGRHALAWNCCDFSIHSGYRTLGVAMKLRRAAKTGIDAGVREFLYAHPNDRMLQVHLTVGHQVLGKMVRYAKLLRLSTRWPVINRASAIALRVGGRAPWGRARVDAGIVENWPIAELDALFEAATHRIGTAVVRDGRYIDWRFRQTPLERTELIVARRGGRLTGYLTFSTKGEVVLVKDWLAIDEAAVDALFVRLMCEMRTRDAVSISVTALESHPDFARLAALGFVRRPDWTSAVVYAGTGMADRNMVVDANAWYMTVGDRDV